MQGHPEDETTAPPVAWHSMPSHPAIGHFVDWLDGQGPRVDHAGSPHGPVLARSVIPLTPSEVSAYIAEGRGVVLAFEGGQTERPLIMGVLQPLASEASPAHTLELPDTPLELEVDGKRISLEAQDEISLRCGKASIVLRRNGRVVIRGTYVESRSSGVQRIRGGTVRIN